jgi:hypothetical protein
LQNRFGYSRKGKTGRRKPSGPLLRIRCNDRASRFGESLSPKWFSETSTKSEKAAPDFTRQCGRLSGSGLLAEVGLVAVPRHQMSRQRLPSRRDGCAPPELYRASGFPTARLREDTLRENVAQFARVPQMAGGPAGPRYGQRRYTVLESPLPERLHTERWGTQRKEGFGKCWR